MADLTQFSFEVLGTAAARTDRHKLSGIVTVDGIPMSRMVLVLDRYTFVLLASTWSDSVTGAWEISGIPEYPERQLLVISVDNTGSYNSEIMDYISQGA